MNKDTLLRQQSEIKHGQFLAENDPEVIWGWGTPAGRLRLHRRVDLMIEKADLKPPKKVLEIGCGTGLFSQEFAKSGAQIHAVDISAELLERARQRCSAENVHFIHKGFEDLPDDGSFDAVVGCSILHHLDIDFCVNKIYRLLKPGGVMCFSEPNMLNPQILLQKNIPWLKKALGDSPDETAYIRFPLASKLKKAGFSKIEITPFDWLHPWTPAPMIPFVKALGQVLEKIPLVRELAGSIFICAWR
ncbi:MAG: methyltransferase domain-containing protein [Candidatus Omnitrophica bacterium]|nr:methyltransferase domain-containing protein [Candidatus Omnitrophota bacterium]